MPPKGATGVPRENTQVYAGCAVRYASPAHCDVVALQQDAGEVEQGYRQAARLTAQRRQRRVSTSRELASGPWHFSQRLSRMVTWCARQALVAGFSAWRVQPSHTHLPKVMGAPFESGRGQVQAMCR